MANYDVYGCRDNKIAERMDMWFRPLNELYRASECVKMMRPRVAALFEMKHEGVLAGNFEAGHLKYQQYGYAQIAEGREIPAYLQIYRERDVAMISEMMHDPETLTVPPKKRLSEREFVELCYGLLNLELCEDELSIFNNTKKGKFEGQFSMLKKTGSAVYDPLITDHHIEYGRRCAAYDIDHLLIAGPYIKADSPLFMEMDYGEVNALVDYKKYSFKQMASQRRQDEWEFLWKAYSYLADGIKVPAFSCFYLEDTFAMFVVPLNKYAKEWVPTPEWVSDREWCKYLYAFKKLKAPKDILLALSNECPDIQEEKAS